MMKGMVILEEGGSRRVAGFGSGRPKRRAGLLVAPQNSLAGHVIGRATELRLVLVAIVDLAPVLETGETCLDVVEFRRRLHVAVSGRKDGCHLFLRFLDAIRSLRMGRKGLG